VAVLGQIGGDAHLGHEHGGNLLPGLGPDLKEVLEAGLHRSALAGEGQPQYRLRLIVRNQLPGGRGRRGFLGGELDAEFLGSVVKVLPLLDKPGARQQLLEAGELFGSQFRCQQPHLRRGQIRVNPLHQQLDVDAVQLFEGRSIGFGGGPGREELLHPAFGFERLQNLEGVLFVADLFEFIAAQPVRHGRDTLFAGVVVARPGALVHLPAGAGGETGDADHAGGIFEESVIVDQAQVARLHVGNAVQRIEQQAVGALIEGDGHGVDGEVAAAQVLQHGRPVVNGFAGLGVFLAAGAGDLDADAAGKPEKQGAGFFMLAPEFAAGFLQCFLELESISLNRKIKVADGKARGEITHSSAGEKDCHASMHRRLTNLFDCVALGRGKPVFKKIDIVGHASNSPPGRRP